MIKPLSAVLSITLLLVLTSCGGGTNDSSEGSNNSLPPDNTDGAPLSYQTMVNGNNWPAQPVQLSEIIAPPEAADGLSLFGTITAQDTTLTTNGPAVFMEGIRYDLLPAFTLDLFTQGNRLVPVQRDILAPRRPGQFWQLIFSEGRVWSQPDDQGMYRAQLTVTLVNGAYANAHNGLLTFLYNENSVSQAWLQVSQENVDWLKYDYWGPVALVLNAKPESELQPAIDQYDAEQAQNVLVYAWSDLQEEVGPELLANFNSDIADTHISASGLITSDGIYPYPVSTRHGDFPYPGSMRHGVYSVAKSMAAALTLFRLAQVYGTSVLDAKISDYVEVSASHNGWENVTFSHALSMATGTGDNSPDADIKDIFADEHFEQDGKLVGFYLERSAQDKLALAFSYGNYPWGPGEIARYNTTVTFVLAQAMQNYLMQMGDDRPLWRMMQEDVFAPMGMSQFAMMHTEETDGKMALPILGVGVYPNIQDTAKVTKLLQQRGVWAGRQLLHPEPVTQILNFDTQTGLPAEPQQQDIGRRYHHGFWAQPFELDDSCSKIVPFMVGYGNNYVLIVGENVALYRYQDSFNNDKLSMLQVAHAVKPVCSD